jgi:hypothetical protein
VEPGSAGTAAASLTSLQVSQQRFCGFGVVQDVEAAVPTLSCPQQDRLAWNATLLAASLVINGSDYDALGPDYWKEGSITARPLAASRASTQVWGWGSGGTS